MQKTKQKDFNFFFANRKAFESNCHAHLNVHFDITRVFLFVRSSTVLDRIYGGMAMAIIYDRHCDIAIHFANDNYCHLLHDNHHNYMEEERADNTNR